MTRRPLVPLAEELRQKLLRDRGLDADMLPLSLTPDERRAAVDPGLPAPEVKPMEPLIPPKVAAIAAVIGSILGVAATFASGVASLPVWLPFLLSALGAVALFLAGKAVPPLKVGGPLVQGTAVPLLLTVSTGLVTFATQMQPGALQGGLLLVASLVAGLAGKVAPQEVAAPPVTPPAG